MPAVESPRAPVPGPWVIHDHAGARAALADPALSRQPLAAQSALPLRGHVLNSEGATHRALRAAVADALGTRVDRHAPGIGAVAVSLLDDVVREASGGAPVDMASRFVVPLTLHAVDVVMGLTDAGAQLEWWCRWALEVDVAPDGDPLRRALEHGASEMRSLLDAVRSRPASTMLGALASSPDVDGAVATAAFSFLAGFTNTANLLALTLLALARHPEQYSRLRETPEAVRRALDELLRYAEPDGRVSLRVARHDVDIAGRRCPAGTTVQISRALAARDPEVFRDPDTLDIDRPAPIAHLAFGHGRHRCPAPRLVRLTVGIVLHALRVRVTAMSPAGGDVAWDVAARRPLLLRISTAQQASTAKRPPQEGQRT